MPLSIFKTLNKILSVELINRSEEAKVLLKNSLIELSEGYFIG